MGEKHRLHVCGVDVVAADNDHVFLAVGDMEVALLIQKADVAGMHVHRLRAFGDLSQQILKPVNVLIA
jgi:hypothetical protein